MVASLVIGESAISIPTALEITGLGTLTAADKLMLIAGASVAGGAPEGKPKFGKDNPLLENWGDGGKGVYQNALKHYDKHGSEVGAMNFDDYLRKAEAFKDTVLSKKGLKTKEVTGVSPDVYRYYYNRKYIDLQYIYGTDPLGFSKIVDYKIISYGLQ